MDPALSTASWRLLIGEIDVAVCDVYGIGVDDRAAIEASFVARQHPTCDDVDGEDDEREEDDAARQTPAMPFTPGWSVVAFGRFDPRLATGERPIPSEPEPFDPLPSRSPGM